jgi:hypothetical protein
VGIGSTFKSIPIIGWENDHETIVAEVLKTMRRMLTSEGKIGHGRGQEILRFTRGGVIFTKLPYRTPRYSVKFLYLSHDQFPIPMFSWHPLQDFNNRFMVAFTSTVGNRPESAANAHATTLNS